MVKTLSLCVALLSLAFSVDATANWQYTRWGMTQKQVQATSGKPTPLTPDEQTFNSAANSYEVALLQAPYSSGQYQFNAIFYFDRSKGTLTGVKLNLINIDRAGELMGSLRKKYGTPSSEKRDAFLPYAIWFSGGDQISYLAIGDKSVSIRYTPRNSADNAGL